MNRRELLKFSLLAPLAGLFKSRKSGASTGVTSNCQGAKMTRDLRKIYETTGTSSEGAYYYHHHFWKPTWSDGKNYWVVCDCDECKKLPKPMYFIEVGAMRKNESRRNMSNV